VLALPPAAAFNTRHKGRHRFIRRARLKLVVATFLGFTFAAGEIVG